MPNMTGRSLQRRLKKRSKTCPRTKLATLIKSELIKAGGTAMETVLLQLFNWLWTGEVMPTAWSQGVIVNLSKLETLSSQAITEG
jgi:hypothetical protein